jgi:hypothetical protein
MLLYSFIQNLLCSNLSIKKMGKKYKMFYHQYGHHRVYVCLQWHILFVHVVPNISVAPVVTTTTLWHNSPLPAQGSFSMRFLDHVAGAPWVRDQLAARWPSHSLPQISNHSRSAHQSPPAIRPAEITSSKPYDWARNMAAQFCLHS